MMRGYNKIFYNNDLGFIKNIKIKLINFGISESGSSALFGAGIDKSSLIVKQFIASRLLNYNFNKQLLVAISKPNKLINYPLPRRMALILEKQGIQANTFSNRIRWYLFLFYIWLSAVYFFVFQILFNFFYIINYKKFENKPYSYFHDLSVNCLPIKNNSNQISHDIITWYLLWKGKDKNIQDIYHNAKINFKLNQLGHSILPINGPFLPLNFLQLLKFITKGSSNIFLSLFSLFSNNYNHILLIRELLKSLHIRLQDNKKIANDYLFHNSNHIYRPLWTYEAESKGARVLFYFYSTNIETFKEQSGYPISDNNWNLLTWSNYLVWDIYQKKFINKQIKNNKQCVKFYIVGNIWFNTSNIEIPLKFSSNDTVTVFDVQPFRSSFYQSLGVSNEYYIPKIANCFLNDINEVVTNFNFKFVLKRKRDIGNRINKAYLKNLEILTNSNNIFNINPNIDTIDLISNSNITISMPFTSTALIARELGKLSIYYDPSGIIEKDDIAAHGIPIISGKDELISWFTSQFKK